MVKAPTSPLDNDPITPLALSQNCKNQLKGMKVAVVGAGLGGLMAAVRLSQHGVKVTVYEAHPQVGGRVRSNHKFANGRIIEEGAELIGSFHTAWLKLAQKYGIVMINRMGDLEYERERLNLKLPPR
jgi:monoamine oxidase